MGPFVISDLAYSPRGSHPAEDVNVLHLFDDSKWSPAMTFPIAPKTHIQLPTWHSYLNIIST